MYIFHSVTKIRLTNSLKTTLSLVWLDVGCFSFQVKIRVFGLSKKNNINGCLHSIGFKKNLDHFE